MTEATPITLARHTLTRDLRSVRTVIVPLRFCMQLLAGFAVLVGTVPAQAQSSPGMQTDSPVVVVAFVGGFVHSDDMRHSEVQVVQQLQADYGSNVRARVFENRRRKQAHKFILDSLGLTPDHKLSQQEEAHARIILFGHSWGASNVVYLARDLQQDGLPVLLTVQVDSIRKHGEDDSSIPSNVKEAINLYQSSGILHGRPTIKAYDPSKTTIVGNFLYQYDKEPAACSDYPWYNRLLFKGHTAIECDPQVWSRVASLVRTQLPQPEVKLAAVHR